MTCEFISSLNACQSILENAIEGILIAEIKSTRFKYANPAICEMFGYPNEEFLTLSVRNIHPPEHSQVILDTFKAKSHGDKKVVSMIPCLRKDGTIFWADINTSKVKIQNIPCIAGFFSDVSERYLTEQKLRFSEELFSNAFNIGPAAMTITRIADGKFLNANESFCTLFEFKREEVIGHTSIELNMWSYEQRKKLIEIQKSSGGLRNCELEVKTKTGKNVFLLFSSVPIEVNGESCHLTTMVNITEHKRAESYLKESEEKFKNVFDAANVGKSITFPTGEIFVNKAFCTMLGYLPEELCAKTWQELTPKEEVESIQNILDQLLYGKKDSARFNKRYIHKDGTFIWADVSVVMHCDKSGKPVYFITTIVDITELMRTTEAYKSIVENTLQGLAIFQDGHIKFANQAMTHIFGLTLEELKALSTEQLFARVHPEDVSYVRNKIQMRLSGKEVSPISEFRYLRMDGNKIWLQTLVAPIQYQGRPAFQNAIIDITERKKAEEDLRKSEETFSVIFKKAPFAAGLTNIPDGTYVEVNEEFNRLFGFSREETIGRTSLELGMYPDPRMREHSAAMFREQGFVHDLDMRLRTKTGEIRDVLISSDFVEIGGQKYILTTAHDITERKRAENTLAAEKERLAVTLRSIGDGVITTDIQGNVIIMNKVAEDLTGWKQSEAESRPLTDVFNIVNELTREPCANPVDKVLSSGGIVSLENHTILVNRNGLEYIIADSGAPIKDHENRIVGVVLVFRDMTEKRKLLENAQRADKLNAIGILAGGIAHDFNNLLGGIFGYIDLAKTESKDDKVSNYLSSALNAINRVRGLTRQLLTFAKGGAPVQKVASFFPFIQDSVEFALSGSNIICRFNVAEDLWSGNIDKNQVGQVIDNIIINAQQAMPDGGTIEITAMNISVGEQEHAGLFAGNYVKISIKDSGIGIPKEIMPRIFDPFYTTKAKGHGLGLATCYSIINQHGGAIEVESEPGKGTTFHVFLPASLDRVDKTTEVLVKYRGSGRIIVMDDEEVMRETIGNVLESLGYSVEYKNEGKAVLDFFMEETKANREITGIILDLTIRGGMGGLKIIREIRKLNSEIPVFIASGYADDPVMKNPTEYGFTAGISKPFMISELTEMLAMHLKIK